MNYRRALKKTWYFIWEDDSIWSWLVNIVLAFVLIKFIVYPGLGLLLGTSHPVVAVVSGSMEHESSFSDWWDDQKGFYLAYNITQDEFRSYSFRNGFNTGDIMVLRGAPSDMVAVGDVIVFRTGQPDPVIHRVVHKYSEDDRPLFQTKGDHNVASRSDEKRIVEQQVIGRALFRIPLLGWIKIGFVKILELVRLRVLS
jgi:signal peptidase I